MKLYQIPNVGAHPHQFIDGVTFDHIIDDYIFDRKLRLIVLDVIERIEVALKSILTEVLAPPHTPHWYMKNGLFSDVRWHGKFIYQIKKQINHDRPHNRDKIIHHYYNNYSYPDMPPSWMVFEVISFGVISRLFSNLVCDERREICRHFNESYRTLKSWFHSISYVRNICAHHARLWNRTCTVTPHVNKTLQNVIPQNDKIYSQLVVMKVIMDKVKPGHNLKSQLEKLFDKHPNVIISHMGFPEGWHSNPFWI